MSWLSLTVNVDVAYAESLSEALLEFGALSVDMHDADADTPQEQAIFGEPGVPTASLWSHNCVTALFPADAAVEDILLQASLAAGLQHYALARQRLGAIDAIAIRPDSHLATPVDRAYVAHAG